MIRRIVTLVAASLIIGSLAMGQKPPEKKPQAPVVQPAHELADALAQRLSSDMHVKTVVGDPIKAGSLTLIPILTMDVSFGGGGVAVSGVDGFFMSGEARPLGFVVIGKKGARFISVARTLTK
ncbi:MAG: hypothetical protein ACLP59_10995 [Bryobacteraceae bacterium]